MTGPGHTARRLIAVLAAGVLTQLALPLLPHRLGSVLIAVSLTVIALHAGAGYLAQSRGSRGRARLGWAMAAVLSVLWAGTNACYAVYALIDRPLPHPGLSDLFAVTSICLIPPALLILTPATGGAWVRLRRLIDGATISAALFFVSWHFVIAPSMGRVAEGMRPLTVVAPALEILSCALALVALSRSRPGDGPALVLMQVSLLVISMGTLTFIYNTAFTFDRYDHGVGGLYVVSTLLMVLSSRSPLPSRSSAGGSGDGRWGWLPYLPVGICFGTAAYLQIRDGGLGPVLFWVLLCTAILVLVRQFFHLRINQELLHRVHEQRERLAHLAFHDPLTGLANRAMLSERAGAALAGAEPGGISALLLVDLDGFKAVNDTYGHATGDEVLVLVAASLTRCVRRDDLVVRLGGDEFVVFMSGLYGIDEAERIGARILRELARPLLVNGVRMPVRGSAGLAVTLGSTVASDTLLRDADVALYQAKAAGKNRMCLFPPSPALAQPAPPDVRLLTG